MCGIGTIETCLQPLKYLEADNNVVSVTSRTARGQSVSLKTSHGNSFTWKNLSNIAERFWLAIWMSVSSYFSLGQNDTLLTTCAEKMFNQLQLIEFSWWNYKSITNQLLTFHMYPHGGMHVNSDGKWWKHIFLMSMNFGPELHLMIFTSFNKHTPASRNCSLSLFC